MTANKEAYDAAYQRAREGKGSRSLWGLISTVWEDDYSRRSREEGERDGAAARQAAEVHVEETASAPAPSI